FIILPPRGIDVGGKGARRVVAESEMNGFGRRGPRD
ncbi:hypothetical protein A2U01_0060165, partial [Trifolium medium]|nr:hypothetical protein [Trifolium medium]